MRKWIPPHTRASMISSSRSEKRSKWRGWPGNRGLVTSKATRSLWKKSCSTLTTALLTQLWPEGWSGKLGSIRAGVVGVAGSNSGRQFGSASVAGLPSVSARWMASIGRQNRRRYLSFQQAIAASAAPSVSYPEQARVLRRAQPVAGREIARHPAVERIGWACQKIAAIVWSAVRVGLAKAPSALTSLKSRA